jgi:hypothetical protein
MTATPDMKPDVNSLSSVEPHCGEWNEVPIFRQDKTESKRLGLKQHLQQLVDDSTPASIPDFLLQSERIFQEFILLAKECEASDATKTESSPSSFWTVDYADQLTRQLEEVERVHGSKAIQGLSDDLLKLTLQYQDDAQRLHVVILNLSQDSFPQTAPKYQSNLPAKWQPHWKPNPLDGDRSTRPHKRLKVDPNSNESPSDDNGKHWGLVQLYSDFVKQVDKYQALWNELDDLDANTLVLEPSTCPPCRSISERRIAVTEGTSVAVVLDPECPRAKPKSVRWIGAPDTSQLRGRFNNYMTSIDEDAGWSMNISVKENLQRGLGLELPTRPPSKEQPTGAESTTLECSICYNHDLPTEEGGSELPEAVCDNGPCNRHYHETCLHEWLQSLPSSRKSFDRIVGTCPYCNEPISAKLLHNKL